MVAIDDVIKLEISKIAFGGEGLSKIDNMVIFVPGGIPGDILEVKIISKKNTYARGIIQKIIEKSVNRIDSYCDVGKICGGCDFINIDYNFQCEIKTKIIDEFLEKRTYIKIKQSPFFKSKEIFRYRNKVIQPFQKKGNDIITGFYKSRTHNIVSCDDCRVQPEIYNKIFKYCTLIAKQLDIKIYNEINNTGNLKNLMIRSNRSNEIMVCVIVKKTTVNLNKMLKKIYEKYDEIVSAYFIINTRRDNVLLSNNKILKHGDKSIVEIINKNKFHITPDSFFQINKYQFENLYSVAMLLIKDINKKIIIDAYSGTGTIATLISNAKKVYAIESVKFAVENAKQSALENNIFNIEFINEKVENFISNIFENQKNNSIQIDTLIVDPPRKGIAKSIIDAISKYKISEVIYISCNVSTFFRDLDRFYQKGYVLDYISGIDMFPNTSHIEIISRIIFGDENGEKN